MSNALSSSLKNLTSKVQDNASFNHAKVKLGQFATDAKGFASHYGKALSKGNLILGKKGGKQPVGNTQLSIKIIRLELTNGKTLDFVYNCVKSDGWKKSIAR